MSAKRGRKPEVSTSRKRQLSSDAKIILAFLKKQPQELREICESTKISDRTFYRVSSFLQEEGIIKTINGLYALWNYEKTEENVILAIEKWHDITGRFPTLKEVVTEVGGKWEDIERAAYKTKERTNWSEPNRAMIEIASKKLGEVLVCAARIRDKFVAEDGKSESFDYDDNAGLVEEAKRFLKNYRHLLPKLANDGDDIASWNQEALKFLGENYVPEERNRPYVGVASPRYR